ncbi:hypothetical protein V2J09_021774 [Rumex salicifolius]
MSSSNSPCAACKFLRRKCTQECVFAPYFPADQPKRFADVHKVFGASNVAKILNEIDVSHREDAVNSLAYEAEARLQDPVYGCVGVISLMQQQLKNLHLTLEDSKKELASLVGPTAMMQMLQDPFFRAHYHPMGAAAASSSNPGAMMGMTDLQQQFQQQQIGAQVMQSFLHPPQQQQQQQIGGGGQLVIRERQSHKQQLLERQMMVRQQQQQLHGGPIVIRDHIQFQAQQAQIQAQQQAQFAAAEMQVREEQEMMRNYEQQQQQQAQIQAQQQAQQQHQQQAQLMRFHGEQFGPSGAVEISPMLALGSGFDDHNPYHVQQQEPLLMLQQPQQPDPQAILQIQQQEQQQEIQEIQDIQDNPLFHDHNLHTPEPGHD